MNLNPLTLIRRRAYRAAFDNPEGRKVLADSVGPACSGEQRSPTCRRARESFVPTAGGCFVNNVHTTYLLEGRGQGGDERGKALRITAHLQLDRGGCLQTDRGIP